MQALLPLFLFSSATRPGFSIGASAAKSKGEDAVTAKLIACNARHRLETS
jgi:hypothetical protein